uniref:Uncharacterized protein n=1 Tax=Rhizophagus irregularis (strain DAOM 181602 / DAOM 197198 / MUCL 43194) TaxID=747089 RepID=U9TQR8_RHIID
MQELLADDAIQCEHTLLNLLKSKYPFREETNQNILYDYEIRRLADFYNITDFYPVLACLDGAIYMWSRTDESMIFGGHNLKEALENYLFIKKIFATFKITSMNLYNEKKS